MVEPVLREPVLALGERRFDLTRTAVVVGIVNRTPDSFYDRGSTFGLDSAVAAAEKQIREGADWLDVGGVPFGPGPDVTVADEIDRVVPVIERIRAAHDVVISVDTTRSGVARAALAAGADVVNDTSGLYDPEMAATVAEAGAGIVLVHSAAPPRTRIRSPQYADLVGEVRDFLLERIERAEAAGVDPARIVIDPGHDLHKNTFHSLQLTRELGAFTGLGRPVFVAVSNKDFIGEALDAPIDQRVIGTVVVATICLLQGARLLRVHNVAEAVTAVRTTAMTLGWDAPAHPRHNM